MADNTNNPTGPSGPTGAVAPQPGTLAGNRAEAGQGVTDTPLQAPGNSTKEPAAADQSTMATQPSQTLNPEPPKGFDKNERIKVRVAKNQGKHKYQNPDTGEWTVAKEGEEVQGGVTRHVLDSFPSRFEIIK